jgi:hypothetical protein
MPGEQLQLLGFEIYGKDARHYAFRGILHNYGIEKRPDIEHGSAFKAATPRNLLKFGATQRIDWGFALLPS